MRIFALSDIHVDYDANARWIAALSTAEYQDDVLILAGDVSDTRRLLEWCLGTLARKFMKVLFVPGNHELWVIREDRGKDSLQKFDDVCRVVESSGASMRPFRARGLAILPLLGWYDYSFGEPSEELRSIWMDYHACRWPDGVTDERAAAHFSALNDGERAETGDTVITYSHFVPRIDLMPDFIPRSSRVLYPILGSVRLEAHVRRLSPRFHVYGHSHLNRRVLLDGVTYINNALGYPNESRIAARRMVSIHEL